uniref:NADH-ubiquinone oxidoreductase chain 6 n=1 Tax=Vulcanolepas fijiensis TaxID=2511776 RepID=A0A649YDP4_9CRUS|nr:NADH dehydrogenase subunit 6 [Vulcanolepas fijiensis]QGL53225.1 NADH dehydrogenase subunit 6 [Vulcanolepas fijiensis]
MLLNTLLSLMFLINLLFLFMFHPLSMIFALIIQTLIIAITIFYLTQFPWFSYTLILIFLGGMLILFMYMSNIAANEMFKPNFKMLLLIPITALIIPMFMKTAKQNLNTESKMEENNQFINAMILKPFTAPIFPITLLMATYIILTLLVVVKITKMNQGPLRIF